MANKNLFTQVAMAMTPSNVFDLTHDVKMSTKMGRLTPIMCLEAVPGDKFNISCESLLRFAPLVAPVMHRMDVSMHYFFVPNRILWPNWEKFITNDPSAPAPPTIACSIGAGDDEKSLAAYLGLPVIQNAMSVSALPFAAYQCIWNEYYRDQNLINPVNYKLTDGANIANANDLRPLRTRAWEHDYFTSALPFAQKGGAVQVPGGPVVLDPNWNGSLNVPHFQDDLGNTNIGEIGQGLDVNGVPNIQVANGGVADQDSTAYDPDGTLIGQGTTVNDLRRSIRLQEWLEKMARGGSRYIEVIKSHFNVNGRDSRLQRPEYITGTKSPVVISEVLNTTGENAGLPQGNMAGHGVSVTTGKYGSYRADEHGYIIGIMSIMPKTAYQQGIPRHFSRTSPVDYYWPSFASIGEQEIAIKELYADAVNPDATFGYTPRYSEYKYMPSRVAGDFQTTLDFWHLGRIFGNEPALNQNFIEMHADNAERIFAVQGTEDNLYCHVLNKVRAVRKMPRFGTPTI